MEDVEMLSYVGKVVEVVGDCFIVVGDIFDFDDFFWVDE